MKAGSLTQLYRRLLAIDGAEAADRVRQEVQSHLDFIRYKTGADFAPPMQAAQSDAQVRFFFAPEAVSRLCSRLAELFPDTSKQVIQRADRICDHKFDLLGYESVDYGKRIDWHCDRVHNKRAPRKPWYEVRYLEFDEVGDSKITWELNRHQHLVTLAKAFRLTGHPKFAQEIFLQWEHWHAENPYPIGINWVSSLEVAFRSLSWLWTYFLLADSPVMPTNFRAALVRSLGISGRHIESYLSTYFSPNTHLLGEAVALFFIGVLCPEISSAPRWQKRGWELIQQEAKRQVRVDGLHFEQSIYYHVYVLDFLLHAVVLASVNEMPVPDELGRTVERMLNVLAALARGGAIPRFGDDDGGRVFDPARNLGAHLTDPLATGAVLFERGDFKKLVGGLREETLWLLGESGVEEYNRIQIVDHVRESVALEKSGLYIVDSAESGRQLVIHAGPWNSGPAGHRHADALSITATAAGHDLLIDSGTLEYVGGPSERDRFRRTRAHNTLLIDSLDQAEPDGPFAWKSLPCVSVESWISGKLFDLFASSHNGYARLPQPVIHRRFVFSLKNEFWLVRDLAMGSGEHQLDLHWHIAPEIREHAAQKDCFVQGDQCLRFITVENSKWSRSVEANPHSPVYGKRNEHLILHFSSRAQLPAEFVTLLAPSASAKLTGHRLTTVASQDPSAAGYRYQFENDEHLVFFGDGTNWKLNGWSSDAEFLYVKMAEHSSGPIVVCCNATEVVWNEKTLLTATRPVLRCEITGQQSPEIESSDPDAISVNAATWKALCASSFPENDFKLT